MTSCAYCRGTLAPGPPWAPGEGNRLAFDPDRGRLWNVCSRCSRWNLTPLDSRWETLQACEEAVATRGRLRLSTTHLSLVDVGAGDLIRVGLAPRPEFVDWRYGPRLAGLDRPRGFLSRVLSGLPPPPVDGYDPYGLALRPVSSRPWLASPFLESASSLTYLFSQIPLAPECPSCRKAMALRPWDFQALQFVRSGPGMRVLAPCGLCGRDVSLILEDARPTLRLGLSLVTPPGDLRDLSQRAAREMDSLGGEGLLGTFSDSGITLGEMGSHLRVGLIISLDEMAETEALEAEWREAEELASIVDGELTDVPGFDAFRREIMDRDE
jgi:hypothetical protein